MNPGTLILHRKKHFIGLNAAMEVFINDKSCGVIKSGEAKEFNLNEGTYNLNVKQNYKSGQHQIVIDPNKISKYIVVPSNLNLVSFISPLIGLGLLFLFKIQLIIVGLILLPGAITSIYLISSGKTKYFTLKKIR